MKYKVILAACTALLPTMVSGQSLQVKDCRTLEAAGNFLGPDEVMADGLVCKIDRAKPASSAAAQASRKDSDRRAKLALLGIIDTTDTKSQEPDAKSDSGPAAITPEASAKYAPGGTAVSESRAAPQNATFELDPGPSLGEVARAYQKSSRRLTAKKPEDQVATEAPATATPEVKSEARRATAAPSLTVVPTQKTDIPAHTSAVIPAEAMDPKTEATPAASASAAPAAAEAQSAAKTSAIEGQPTLEVKLESAPAPSASAAPAVAEAHPATKAPAMEAEPSPEVKLESSPEPLAPVTPAPEASQPEMKTRSFDAQEESRSVERPEVSAAMPEPESESTSERPQEVKLGVFETPKESTAETKPQEPVDPFGAPPEDVEIHEPRPGCAKIVSLGSMERDRLVLATPDWALKWLEKNQKRFPGMCFADSPLAGMPNYLIVFFTAAPPASQAGLAAKALVSASTSSRSSGGTFTTSFGSTWHYTYENAATTTVTTVWTENVAHNLKAEPLYATAYTEQGIPISEHWPTPMRKRDKVSSVKRGGKHDPTVAASRMMSELLDAIVEDIAKY